MKRKILHPQFKTCMTHAFSKSKEGRGLFTLVKLGRPISAEVIKVLELHSPRYVASLVRDIKKETEEEFFQAFATREFGDPAASINFVKTIIAACPEAAFPLTTVWSGYVREAAVKNIQEISGPFCLALLVYRLNDWVEPVRRAAEKKLIALEGTIPLHAVLGCLELLLDFDRFKRVNENGTSSIQRLISKTAVHQEVLEFVKTSTDDRASRLLKLCLRNDGFDQYLPLLASSATSWRIRLIALKTVTQEYFVWRRGRKLVRRDINLCIDVSSIVTQALVDSSSMVQASAVQYVISHLDSWSNVRATLLPFLTHRAVSVADRAFFGLKTLGVDALSILREKLTAGATPNHTAAILLGRYGEADDAVILLSAADHCDPNHAMPLLYSAVQLGSKEAIKRLRALSLSGVDKRSARTASKLLLKSNNRIDDETLLERSHNTNDFIERGLPRHIAKAPVMVGLVILCRLDRGQSEFETEKWLQIFQRRINQSMFQPTVQQTELLKAELQLSPHLSGELHRRFLITL